MLKTILIETNINTIDNKRCSCRCQFYYETYTDYVLCSLNGDVEMLKPDDRLYYKRTSFCLEREKVFINKGEQ